MGLFDGFASHLATPKPRRIPLNASLPFHGLLPGGQTTLGSETGMQPKWGSSHMKVASPDTFMPKKNIQPIRGSQGPLRKNR